jgi:hypothetical protein
VISRVGYDVHNKKDAARVFYLFFTLTMQPLAASSIKIETSLEEWSLISMKTFSLIIAVCFLAFGATVSQAAVSGQTRVLTRISGETGVPVNTLQAQKAATGLGYGSLENANLLANASGQSFDTIVGKFRAGEGWGKIAHDYGLNLGRIVSNAHRSAHAQTTTHGKSSVHGKSTTSFGKGHMNTMKGAGHGMGGMGHGHGGH